MRRLIKRAIPTPRKLKPKGKPRPLPSIDDLVIAGTQAARDYARDATGSAQTGDYSPSVVAEELVAAYLEGIRKGLELSRELWL